MQKQPMRKVLAVSISVIGLAPAFAAWAEDDEIQRQLRPESEIEVGFGSATDSDFKFGDYTGLGQPRTHAIGNIHYIQRGEHDARWMEIVGRNLGLDSRNLRIEGGEQGNYKLRLEYDQIPKLWSDSYQTPYVNPGDTSLALPAGWVAGANTSALTNLNASMRPYDVKTMRKSIGLGLTKLLPAGWEVVVDYKREKKEGDRFIGAAFGTGGGNPKAVVLPEPVDYTTEQFEAIARYTAPKLQFQVGYYGSFFRNENDGLTWVNAFNAPVAGQTPAQIGLPPGNQFHQINASGGYSFSRETRLSGAISFGRMTQDDSFLPYTVNPGLNVALPLPRSSLNGKIDTTHVSFRLTSKLAPKLHLNASYRYNDRDNKTPQSQYVYVHNDSADQDALGATDNTRTNLPGSSTKQQLGAELDYHLASATKLKFGYEYDWAKKTYEAIKEENEHTVMAGLDHRFGETASAGVKYAYSDRDTSKYNAGAPFLATYTGAAYIAGIAPISATDNGLWDNVPTQKKFFLAPRKRDSVRVHAGVSPTERLDLQFSADYKSDDYHESYHGLRKADGWSAHFDANLIATDAVTGHMFASYEDYGSNQRSAQLGGNKAQYTNPGWDWTADIDDRTVTFGMGFRVKPGGRYELGGDFSHAYSRGEIEVIPGTLSTTARIALPDIVTRLDRLELFGKYWLQKDVSLNMKYVYEHYRSKDFAYDAVLGNSMANVIGTNQITPDYRVHLLGVSLAYRFR